MSTNNINKEAESVQKLNKKRKVTIVFISVCTCLLALVVLVGMGFSWFAPTKSEADADIKVTKFSTVTKYSFDGATYTNLDFNTVLPHSSLSSLSLTVDYNGESDAYIRVKPFESFCTASGTEIVSSAVSYTTSSDWQYNADDGYYYYKKIATANETIDFVTGGASITSPVIEYGDTDGIKLVLVIEEVQPDRFKEFFGFEPTF